MGFTIPNYTDAVASGVGDQAEPDSVDFQILGDGTAFLVYDAAYHPNNGQVTETATASQSVNVAPYRAFIKGVYYGAATTSTVTLEDGGANPRFDIVVVNSSGLAVRKGTESSTNPVFPTISDGDIALAAVYRPSGAGASSYATTARIVDKRVVRPSNSTWLKNASPTSGEGVNGDLWVDTTATATGQSMVWIKRSGVWENLAEYVAMSSTNTANNIVIRDASGNFSAGAITASLNGNASTATNATNAANATLATKASTLSQGGGNGTAMTFNWSGQNGQPTWLWGSNDGTNHYVYNPANFNVDKAKILVTPSNSTLVSYDSNYLNNWIKTHTDISPSVDNAHMLGIGGFTNNSWLAVSSYNYITSSDERLKKDIEPTNIGLDFINKLNPVSYKFIVGSRTVTSDESVVDNPGTRPHYGFIAQEVKQVIDELGLEDFGGWGLADKDNPDSTQTLRPMEFIAPMVKAIQELSARVEALEEQ